MAMVESEAATATPERRRSVRHRVPETRRVTATAGGRLYGCTIEDISVDGIRVRFDTRLPLSNVIAIDHPVAGTLCGVAAWRDKANMGIEIQLPRGELERVLKAVCLVL
ncbi:MAG TPA: PilZ domain-containing protein [Kiloniellales bacterium]|nr:PilZ domain-containing protein [Kiloniellales bacterium]